MPMVFGSNPAENFKLAILGVENISLKFPNIDGTTTLHPQMK
jgi:hypothetical protein